MLKSRAGFTLAEVLIALVLTAVLGAAATTTFVSQSRFFDKQDKVSAARGVSRSSLNMVLSEVRMVERSGGVEAAEADSITLNVPYAMGLYCSFSIFSGNISLSMLPVDSLTRANAAYSGYAHRTSETTYEYETTLTKPTGGLAPSCTGAGVNLVPDVGGVVNITTGVNPDLKAGTPVLLYQRVSYIFRASTSVPGAIALWRHVHDPNPLHPPVEELVAPFAPSAGFGYYVGDVAVAQSSVAAGSLDQITGIELTLDGTSERPESDGSYQVTPYSTSIFFKNR